MGNRRKTRREVDTSCSHASTSDDLSETEEEATTPPPPRRSSHGRRRNKVQRNTRDKEDNVIQILEKNKEDIIKEMCKISKKLTKQFEKLTESHNDLRKQLEAHINGSSGDDSSTPRSETNQVPRPPKYRLKFKCEIKDEIKKGQVIETKENGETITVGLYDEQNQIVEIEPYASLNVMLVVLNGEFNEHGNQYNWSRKDFERNIKRPRQGNSSMGDEHQLVESIVSNCVFTLDRGVQSHSDATILYNSSNKKVRLGVMVLSPTEERVLEGLSNHFFVRGCDRPKRQKKSMVGGNHQEGNGTTVIAQNQAYENVIQKNPTCENVTQAVENRISDDDQIIRLFDSSNFMDQYMTSDNLINNESSPRPTNTEGVGDVQNLLQDQTTAAVVTVHGPCVGPGNKEIQSSLPPRFRFHPTDEELIVHYLHKRANAVPCPVPVIAEVDIYMFNPWDLPERAIWGDSEWYFFSPRDRKYANCVRPNRAAGSGYWKATGTDKPIHRGATGVAVGVRNALVFYKGRPPRGSKTNWVMHEYRLSECLGSFKNYERSMRMDEWVLCRIYKKMTTLPPLYSSRPYEASNNLTDFVPGSLLPLYSSRPYEASNNLTNFVPESETPPTSHVGSISDYIDDYSNMSELFNTLEATRDDSNQDRDGHWQLLLD